MIYTTIIAAETLALNLNNPDWIVIDCRFSLANPEAGFAAYQKYHLPNAQYAHLDNNLSSAITSDTGRHPLPVFSTLATRLGEWGISNDSQVIVYDDVGCAMAGRLWWLLRYMGHDRVAVLDGGIKHWAQKNLEFTTTLPILAHRTFLPVLNKALCLSSQQVQDNLTTETIQLIDARTPERFSGKQEPIDPVAGHIPGALNRPLQMNLNNDTLFLGQEELQQQFIALIGDTDPTNIAHMCGSGVTACHNLLAMEIAGLLGSKLYAGSWSEWIRDMNRPVARGH